MFRDGNNGFENTVEGGGRRFSVPGCDRSRFEKDLCVNILDTLDDSEAASFGKVLIDCAETPAEDAINGDAKCRSLPVHSPATTDDKVRIPDKI